MTRQTQTVALIDQCREAMGSTDPTDALTVAEAALRRHQATHLHAEEPIADGVAAALAGGPMPADLGARMVAMQARRVEHQEHTAVLQRVITSLQHLRRDRQSSN